MKRMIDSLFLVWFYAITLLMVGTIATKSFLATLLVVPISLMLIKCKFFEKDIDYKKVWILIRIFSFAIMLVVTYYVQVNPSWDWGQLIRTATKYVQDTPEIDNQVYYSRAYNNSFWLWILIKLFSIVKKIYPNVTDGNLMAFSRLLSVGFVQITIDVIYRTFCLLWDKRKAFWGGVFLLMCSPLYLYAQFAYTDTSGILIVAIIIYLYFLLDKEQSKWKHIILLAELGVICALGYKVKVTLFIYFIALLIAYILRTCMILKSQNIRGGGADAYQFISYSCFFYDNDFLDFGRGK